MKIWLIRFTEMLPLICLLAGSSSLKAKQIASQLSLDAGFAECYDFGGDDKVELLEQFAFSLDKPCHYSKARKEYCV
ncbi:MAG: hypothetical protein MZV64_72115 [Ignavibacteriales bacterium]|nr:hypothetical protein [Ignavibacteriales bacterium]